MSTVMLCGSRACTALGTVIEHRVDKIIDKELKIIVGDADGADRAFQKYLEFKQYKDVTIYHSEDELRNYVDVWPTKNVFTNEKVGTRKFYMAKDLQMVKDADYGLFLWDGRSFGTASNIALMLKLKKPIVLYFSPNESIYELYNSKDVFEKLPPNTKLHQLFGSK